MPVIICSINGDQSTYNVIDWIRHFGEEAHLINQENSLLLKSIQLSSDSEITLSINEENVSLNSIISFWHRRGNIKFDIPKHAVPNNFIFGRKIVEHLNDEQRKLKQFLNQEFLKIKCLGNIFNTDLNKLEVLQNARDLGIRIPETLVTGTKKALKQFKLQHDEIICKPISEGLMAHDAEVGLITYYTHIFKDEDIDRLGDFFFTSLFQEKIKKKYELRIFYLNGEFYPMAIFSQEDSQTSVDFRKYNHIKPNRTVPFQLPISLRNKLNSLMRMMNLNTGSIDMAVTNDNEFIFFEINPVGQFKMTSLPCNYYLEKKIAQYLIRNESKTKT